MIRLIGKWVSDPDDAATQESYGRVSQTFHSDGRLIYVIHSSEKDEVMRLTYAVEGDELVTNQLSSPAEHRTKFEFDDRGRLVLDDGAERTRFVRVG
jgi:hypothetical protein